MFCVKCGVRLADTEKRCPLCDTVVYHPDIERNVSRPLYPPNKITKPKARSKAFNGAVLILFFIPLLICFLSDLKANGQLDWFGLAAGALILGYLVCGLPLWFRKPNPIIFVPCDFAAAGLFLLYIDLAAKDGWFLSFAFPVTGCLGAIATTVVVLLRCLRRGRLYIWGGAFAALGGFMLLLEFLLCITFTLPFTGWSLFPLIALVLLGGVLIYLAINRSAREMMERKLFF